MSTINYAPRPSRAPLLERQLRQIVGMCRSSKSRASVLRREIIGSDGKLPMGVCGPPAWDCGAGCYPFDFKRRMK